MRSLSFIIYGVLLGAFSCKNEGQQEPIWIDRTFEITNNDTLYFVTIETGWEATFYTSIQPVQASILQKDDTLKVFIENSRKIKNGNATLSLKTKNKSYFYSVNLKNTDFSELQWSELRTPKSLNLDFPLPQQLFLYVVDGHGNLIESEPNQYFMEELVIHPPNIGTFRGVTNTPLSSFYIGAGEVTGIPINYKLFSSKKLLEIISGPLKDKYGNLIAEGTSARFILKTGDIIKNIDAYVIGGMAKVKVPVESGFRYQVHVQIAQKESITLNVSIP
jgi:hypothetical protein